MPVGHNYLDVRVALRDVETLILATSWLDISQPVASGREVERVQAQGEGHASQAQGS